jgi:hypothetical protein
MTKRPNKRGAGMGGIAVLWRAGRALPEPIRWGIPKHLQTSVVRRVLAIVGLIMFWLVFVALLKGIHVALIVTGSIIVAVFLIWFGIDLYAEYCRRCFERRFMRMSEQERELEIQKTLLEARELIHEDQDGEK